MMFIISHFARLDKRLRIKSNENSCILNKILYLCTR